MQSEVQILGTQINLLWVVIGAALVWQIAVAPALQTWHEAPAKQAALDAQTTHMLQLQAQAKGLQSTPPPSRNPSSHTHPHRTSSTCSRRSRRWAST